MGKKSREKIEKRRKEELKEAKEKPPTVEEKILKKIIFWGTCLILFTPLIVNTNFFFPFVGPKSLYFMGLVEIIFFTWLFLIIFYPQYRPRLNLLLLALILFLVILILASLFGVDPTYSFWSKFERMTGLLMMFHLFGFFLVVFTVFQEKDWIRIFSISISVALLVSFIAWFSKISENSIMRGGGTLGNDSFLGTYLLLNLFLALYLIFKATGGLRVYVFFSFLIVALILFFSEARAAKLSFLGGLILLCLLYLAFLAKNNYLKFLGRAFLVFSLLFFLISIFLIFQEGSIFQQKFIEKASRARLVVWEGAWKGFLERPWLGWGPENFEYVFNKYFNPCMFLPECGGEIWFDRAHNIIFDTLINSGIFGFLTYLLVFWAFFWILWKGYFGKKIDFWTSGIFSVMLISYFVQNLTVFDMVSSYMIFFLSLGFVAHLSFEKKEMGTQRREMSFKFLIASLLLILFLFSFFNFIINPLKTDYYVIKTLKAPNSQERLSLMEKTLKTSLVSKNQIRTFFSEQLIQLIENFQRERRNGILLKQIQPELEFLVKELEKNIKESPLDFRSYLRLGELYHILAVGGDSAKHLEAEKIFKKALEIFPTNQQTYWALAQSKLSQEKKQEALSLAEKALSLEPRYAPSHLLIIRIVKLIGDEELLKRKIEEAIKIIPDLEPEIKKILELRKD